MLIFNPSNFLYIFSPFSFCEGAGASEASEETKHWRGKRLFVNHDLPLQCFVCSEPSDASVKGGGGGTLTSQKLENVTNSTRISHTKTGEL